MFKYNVNGLTKKNPKKYIIETAIFLLLFIAVFYIIYNGINALDYNWQWFRVIPFFYNFDGGSFHFGSFYDGLIVTLQISILSFIFAIIIGTIAMLFTRSKSFIANYTSLFYVEIIRNTPILVQIYIIYFIFAPIFNWGRFTCGVIALAIFEGAYVCEILRSGVNSVSTGQWDASKSLGLSKFKTLFFIILPQMIQIILPPITNVIINLVKHSSIVSVIAVADLTTVARNGVADTFLAFELWFAVAGIYLVLTIGLSIIFSLIENKYKIKSY